MVKERLVFFQSPVLPSTHSLSHSASVFCKYTMNCSVSSPFAALLTWALDFASFRNKTKESEQFLLHRNSTAHDEARERHIQDIAGTVFLVSAAGDLLKLPLPSKSPRDPLAWTRITRLVAYICVYLMLNSPTVLVNVPPDLQIALTAEFPSQVYIP